MDDFGVLVQKNYGIKPQGKSAPMASSRPYNKNNNININNNNKNNPSSQSHSQSQDPTFGIFTNTNSQNGYSQDNGDDDDFFGLKRKTQSFSSGDVFDDFYNVSSQNSGANGKVSGGGGKEEDLIWGFSGIGGNNSVDVGIGGGSGGGDLLSYDPVDDFLGSLGNIGSKPKAAAGGSGGGSDDLLFGFGMSSGKDDRAQTTSTEESPGVSLLDELEKFATSGTTKSNNGKLKDFSVKRAPKITVKHNPQETSFIDIEGSYNGDSGSMFQTETPDLDSFFRDHSQKRVPAPEATNPGRSAEEILDMMSAASIHVKENDSGFPGTSVITQKKRSPGNAVDAFPSLFVAPMPGKFDEVEGESKERRDARRGHEQRKAEQMANALEELRQREFQAQREQEERHRVAETMDLEIKRWAAGKEGNLRALLSSLQQVLAPELGWRPVTLTDLITSPQVSKAYKKAAFCVHPDKVQQKGCNIQQKYVAERVFDLLKEANNKFVSEELR